MTPEIPSGWLDLSVLDVATSPVGLAFLGLLAGLVVAGFVVKCVWDDARATVCVPAHEILP